MPTINPRPVTGTFNEYLFLQLKSSEGYGPTIYADGVGIPTLGVGYALVVYDKSTRQYRARTANQIDQDLKLIDLDGNPTTVDVKLSSKDFQQLKAIEGMLNAGRKVNAINATDGFAWSLPSISETQFRPLFDKLLAETLQKIERKLGATVYAALKDSQEMAAVASVVFNRGFLSDGLKSALLAGDRAEAWYEIRYRSNPGNVHGIAVRRYGEADLLFNLYDGAAGPLTKSEAMHAIRTVKANLHAIQDYEGKVHTPAGSSYTVSLTPAIQFMKAHYQSLGLSPDLKTKNGDILHFQAA